ncbi:MAG TPA: hypothetical protein VLL69_22435 [Streptosporangiaceae bacterium]|nr:hypothetical protein [Streptosporangiaceae bacterium]
MERVILRDSIESDVDDRLRHPIDPEEEDGYGSSWRICSAVMAGGRPRRTPRARAASSPSWVP